MGLCPFPLGPNLGCVDSAPARFVSRPNAGLPQARGPESLWAGLCMSHRGSPEALCLAWESKVCPSCPGLPFGQMESGASWPETRQGTGWHRTSRKMDFGALSVPPTYQNTGETRRKDGQCLVNCLRLATRCSEERV